MLVAENEKVRDELKMLKLVQQAQALELGQFDESGIEVSPPPLPSPAAPKVAGSSPRPPPPPPPLLGRGRGSLTVAGRGFLTVARSHVRNLF